MTTPHLGRPTQHRALAKLNKVLIETKLTAEIDSQAWLPWRSVHYWESLQNPGSPVSGQLGAASNATSAEEGKRKAHSRFDHPQSHSSGQQAGETHTTSAPIEKATWGGSRGVQSWEHSSGNPSGRSWLPACTERLGGKLRGWEASRSSGPGTCRGLWQWRGSELAPTTRHALPQLWQDAQGCGRIGWAGYSTLAPLEEGGGKGETGAEEWEPRIKEGAPGYKLCQSRSYSGRRMDDKSRAVILELQLTGLIHEANSVAEIKSLCSGPCNVYQATAAFYRMAKLIGVGRSIKDPFLALDRPNKYEARVSLLREPLLGNLLNVLEGGRYKATRKMICLQLWALARLRLAVNTTPETVVVLAEELEAKLRRGSMFAGLRNSTDDQVTRFVVLPVTQALWGLSQLMREDAPWASLFVLLAQELEASRQWIRAGPASTVLKAAANYSLIHGSVPLPPPALDMLAEALMLEDDDYSGFSAPGGPQAVSQGLYALAKLGHHPGEEVLDALAGMLPTLISSITVDRQAVGNSLWALANLGYPIPNTLYKQMIELVLQHCHRFMACHFDQVFAALRLWDRRLTAEQMQTMCRGLAACLPAHPTPLDALEWRKVAEELALVEPYYAGSYQKQVPLLPRVMQLFKVMSRVRSPGEGDWDDESEQEDGGNQALGFPTPRVSDLGWSDSESDKES